MAGLDPAIPLTKAQLCPNNRDRRVEPGDDGGGSIRFEHAQRAVRPDHAALVQELVSARRRDDPLAVLSAREREVLALMAEGRSNTGIAHRLWVTEGTVEKHVRSILTKLNLPETGDDHRRVLAAVTFLEAS